MADVLNEMNAVVLDAYTGPAGLRIARRAIPRPGPGQVLGKIAASPFNPSDIAFIHGAYGFRSPPRVVPGQEGAGTLVAAGEGMSHHVDYLGPEKLREAVDHPPQRAGCGRQYEGPVSPSPRDLDEGTGGHRVDRGHRALLHPDRCAQWQNASHGRGESVLSPHAVAFFHLQARHTLAEEVAPDWLRRHLGRPEAER